MALRLMSCLPAMLWLGVALASTVSVGCRHAINPAVIDDARVSVRVRTAIVNDPVLGLRTIDVRVVRGVAELAGEVGSAAEADRLVVLVRGVAGVSDVRSTVRIVGAPSASLATPARLVQTEPLQDSDDPRLIAVGVSLSWTEPGQRTRDGGVSVGPLVRLGAGDGFAVTADFNWFAFDLFSAPERSLRLAHVAIRPVMAGLGYRISRRQLAAEFSIAGGVAFNSLRTSDVVGSAVALQVDRSLAWRPGVTVWHDRNRVAFNSFLGYVKTRPSVWYLEDGHLDKRSLRADALLVGVGVAYKLF